MITRYVWLGLGATVAMALSGTFLSTPALAEGLSVAVPSVQVAEGKEIKLFRRILSVEDGGKVVTFKGSKQEVVKAKLSSKRTKIIFAKRERDLKKKGKEIQGSTLKAGYICTISYTPGGNNEPKKMDCFAE